MLTLSTFGLDSRSDLPRVSYATALDWYTVMCFLFVVFTLLEFAGVHYFTKVGAGEVPIIELDDHRSSTNTTDSSDDEDSDGLNRSTMPPRRLRNRRMSCNKYKNEYQMKQMNFRMAKNKKIRQKIKLKGPIITDKHQPQRMVQLNNKLTQFHDSEQVYFYNDKQFCEVSNVKYTIIDRKSQKKFR